jgi:hypothetical protein
MKVWKMKTLLIALAMSITSMQAIHAQANRQAPQQNSYTLVYDGTITENVKDNVNTYPVTYKIKDITIAANVYTPPNYDATTASLKTSKGAKR